MRKKNERWMNRLLAVLMAIIMVVALFPTSTATATDSPSEEDSQNGTRLAAEGNGGSAEDTESTEDGSGTVNLQSTGSSGTYVFTVVDASNNALSGVEVTYSVTGKTDSSASEESTIISETKNETDTNGQFSIALSDYENVISADNPYTITYSFKSGNYSVSNSEQITSYSGTHTIAAAYTISVTEQDRDGNTVSGATYTYKASDAAEGDSDTEIGSTGLAVANGSSGTVTIKAPDGYWIYSVTGLDDRDANTLTEFTSSVSNISANTTISVVYEKTYTVTANYAPGSADNQTATVTMAETNNMFPSTNDSITVPSTSSVNVTIAAPANYYISALSVGGKTVSISGNPTSYTFSSSGDSAAITSTDGTDVAIVITLARLEYSVMVTFDSIGSVTMYDGTGSTKTYKTTLVSGDVETVQSGDSYTIIATPSTGYRVSSVTENGGTAETFSKSDYIWTKELTVDGNYTVVITFKINEYSVTATAEAATDSSKTDNCKAEALSGTVSYDGEAEVTLSWEDGYYISGISVVDSNNNAVNYDTNGNVSVSDGIYSLPIKISNITSDITVTATYAANPTVSASDYEITGYLRKYTDSDDGSTVYVYGENTTGAVALTSSATSSYYSIV